VQSDLKSKVRQASVLDPLPQKYDLIVSIKVLEQLSLQDCDRAVTKLCQASDDSSSLPHHLIIASRQLSQTPAR
jgi:hypothetical protein